MMCLRLLVCLGVFYTFSLTLAEEPVYVMDIQGRNFFEFRKYREDLDTLVYFHNPKDAVCQTFNDIYEEVGEKYGNRLYVTRMNVATDTMAAVYFDIKVYPTLRLFDKERNIFWEYHGSGNSAKEIGQWATSAQTDEGEEGPEELTPEAEERYSEIIKMMKENGVIGDDGKPTGKSATPPDSGVKLEGPSKVEVLTDSGWRDTIGDGTWLVEFYAPWCGHCKSLTPVYEELARKNAADKLLGFHVAKVDATVNTQMAEVFEVGGYPTIVAIYKGKYYPYQGPRVADDMFEFLRGGFMEDEHGEKVAGTPIPATVDLSGPSAVEVLEDETIDDAAKGDWFVEFYAPWCGHCKKLEPQWETAARTAKDEGMNVKFAKVDCIANSQVGKRFGIKGYPTLKRIRDGKVYEYEVDGRKADDFLVWDKKEEFLAGTSTPFPARPTIVEEIQEVIQITISDLKILWAMKKLALGIVFALGVVIGAFLVAILTPTPKPRRRKPAEKAETKKTQ